MKSKH